MESFEAIVATCADLATELLQSEGTFAPFGCGVRADGTFRGYLSDDGDYDALRGALRRALEGGEFELVAYVEDVVLATDALGSVTAVAYDVGGEKFNRRILVPYVLERGSVAFFPSFATSLEPAPWSGASVA